MHVRPAAPVPQFAVKQIIALPAGLTYSARLTNDPANRMQVEVSAEHPAWVQRVSRFSRDRPPLDGRFFQIGKIHSYNSEAWPDSHYVFDMQEMTLKNGIWWPATSALMLRAIEHLIHDAHIEPDASLVAQRPALKHQGVLDYAR